MVRGRGLLRIDEMTDSGEFEVWSGKAWRTTTAVESGVQPVVEVLLNNGSRIKLTGDHPILTDSGMIHAHVIDNERLPLELPSDVCFPEVAMISSVNWHSGGPHEQFPREWTRDVGMFLGVVLGDGAMSGGEYPTIIIGLGRQDRDDLIHLRDVVGGWCGSKSQVVDFESSPNKFCDEHRPMSRIQWRVKSLIEFVGQLGLDKSLPIEERRVPSSIWTASASGVSGFLAGLFGTDGAVSVNGAGKIEISMSSVSAGLLEDVQNLLCAFGIKSSMWSYPKKEQYKQLFALSVFGKKNVDLFTRRIGFSCRRKRDALAKAISESTIVGRGNRHLSVESVRDVGVEKVYDLVNVGDERQFVANGISVSNCWDFRRHGRVQVLDALRKGRVMILTEEIWHAYIRDEPEVRIVSAV
jgi:hypothetical protein